MTPNYIINFLWLFLGITWWSSSWHFRSNAQQWKGHSKKKYEPRLRSFALTLSFFSPRAYEFVRNTLMKSLPHARTITKWYTSIDGSPGFTQEALVALKMKQQESLSKSRVVLCNLIWWNVYSAVSRVEWKIFLWICWY